jgi:hypothetical protein
MAAKKAQGICRHCDAVIPSQALRCPECGRVQIAAAAAPPPARPNVERPPPERLSAVPPPVVPKAEAPERALDELPPPETLPEATVGDAPLAEPPVAETPAGETPVGETPVGETPIGETPIGETPVGETPIAESLIAERPVAEAEAEALLAEPAPPGDPAPLSFVTAPPVGADEPDRSFDAVAEPTIAPEVEDEPWTECEITYWRGHVHGEFIAAHFNGLARIDVRWQSVLWPGRDTIPEEKPRTVAALDALDAQLLQDGWERHGHGDWWYARRYRRRISDTEVAEPHQPTPPPEPTETPEPAETPEPEALEGTQFETSELPSSDADADADAEVDLRLRSESIQIRDYLPWRYLRVTPASATGAVGEESAFEPALAEAGLGALLADETAPAEAPADAAAAAADPEPTLAPEPEAEFELEPEPELQPDDELVELELLEPQAVGSDLLAPEPVPDEPPVGLERVESGADELVLLEPQAVGPELVEPPPKPRLVEVVPDEPDPEDVVEEPDPEDVAAEAPADEVEDVPAEPDVTPPWWFKPQVTVALSPEARERVNDMLLDRISAYSVKPDDA